MLQGKVCTVLEYAYDVNMRACQMHKTCPWAYVKQKNTVVERGSFPTCFFFVGSLSMDRLHMHLMTINENMMTEWLP